MRKPKIGLALGSGGARGWCHIGVVRALDALGVKPDVIAGCSMGALVGAAHAGGRLDALESWLAGLTRTRFVSLIDIRPASGGLVEGQEILRMIESLGLATKIEDLPTRFTAVATDMETGREIWLQDGNVAQAVRASVAIPGVISPYRIDDRWLMDGALTNPVPVSACRAMGADVIIAVNPNARLDGTVWRGGRAVSSTAPSWANIYDYLPASFQKRFEGTIPPRKERDRAPHYVDVISTAIDVMTEQIRRSRLAGEPPHVLLNANLSRMSVLELYRGDEAIREGELMVARNADWIRSCVGLPVAGYESTT
ncbi:patatin-like phospholipase family protein [Actibacterium sp. D379-3]